jgi:hypothetical protein
MIAALFWLFLLCASVATATFGDRVSRMFLVALIAGTFGTLALNYMLGWAAAHKYVFAIDAIILLIAFGLVSKTKFFWPIWFCGLHGITVATSLSQLAFPNQIPGIYINIQGFWFFPAVAALVAGVMLDYRAAQN